MDLSLPKVNKCNLIIKASYFCFMNISVGDKVKFINEKLEGEVISLLSTSKVKVSCSDGFDHEVFLSEIIVVGEDDVTKHHIDEVEIKDKIKQVSIHQPKQNSFLSRYMTNTKYQFEKVVEIDLHLEELVEFPNKLDDWQKLHTQMQHVKRCLAAAMDDKVRKLVFIHGVGTGVLRTELINLLSNYDNLSFKDADYREYGIGATEVYIK